MSDAPSHGRLPLSTPGSLDEEQRALYDAIAGGERASGPFRITDERGRLLGPFNALLHSPQLGQAVQHLGAALRFSGSLPDRTRELVICAVAAHWDSDYEWYAHSRVASRVGVTSAELDSLRAHARPAGLAPGEDVALRMTFALLRDRAVQDDLYSEASQHHDHTALVELAVLLGYYQLLAGLLAVADVPAPSDPSPDTTAPHQ